MEYTKITSENCPQELIDFLKKEGAFEAYEKNCNSVSGCFATGLGLSSRIASAFKWIETTQGRYYWRNLESKFENIAESKFTPEELSELKQAIKTRFDMITSNSGALVSLIEKINPETGGQLDEFIAELKRGV